MYDFNSRSNRLMQSSFEDYSGNLKKYLHFLNETAIIRDYINDCGDCEFDLAKEVAEVQKSYGHLIFDIGETDEEEVRNIYAILNYISEQGIQIHYGIAMGYAHSTKYQDIVKGFNERFVYVLIGHIDRYLTKIGIDMGMDEQVTYNITVRDGMVNIATDNSNINATNTVTALDEEQIKQLIDDIRNQMDRQDFTEEDRDIVSNSLEVITDELRSAKPRTNVLKVAVNGLKILKGTAEFGAAVIALVQFIQPFLI